ncbi:MAG TPA: hypothetical protein VLB84_17025 [Bacteroidia bacterium]|nr:hypothetical protein [Bacteroidia bacterium]
MDTFENEYVKIWIENDILFSNYQKNIIIDLDIAKKIIDDRVKFTKGKNYPILIDFTNLHSVTKEARDYMNAPDGGLKGLSAGAFLSNSLVTTLFVNLYLTINKPSIPAKFFTKKAEAITWLKEMSKNH